MFSGFLTWAEAVCGRLRDGTRQRSMAGLGGTFVKFLLLIGELYFLWRPQQDKGEKYRVCQLLLPCRPKGLINLAKIIVHIIVILPSRFSHKLETLCSACCYHWSSFLLQTHLCIWSRLTVHCGCSKAGLLPQESHLAMSASWLLAWLSLSLRPATKYQNHRSKKLIWGLILSCSNILLLSGVGLFYFCPREKMRAHTHQCSHTSTARALKLHGKDLHMRYYCTNTAGLNL